MMKIEDIQSMPTNMQNIHESCFRSYQILEKVIEMLNRGDSKETILELIQLMKFRQINTDDKPL